MTSEEKPFNPDKLSAGELRIDRIEGTLAVVEDSFGHCFPIPLQLLPEGARENHILRFSIQIDEERTQALLKQAKSLIHDLIHKHKD